MSKVTIKSIVHKSTSSDDYCLFGVDMSKYGYIAVGPVEFEYELPAGFNPIAAQVDALEKQRETLRKEFNARINQINDQISKLQCLEFSPAT